MAAEGEHVAGKRFKGEVLVQRAHHHILRVEHNLILEQVGNRPAIGQRGQIGAAPRPHAAIDGVEMQQGPAPAPAGGIAIGKHAHDIVELGAGEVAVRPGAPRQGEQGIEVEPFFVHGGFRDDLLGEDVERFFRHADAVQPAIADRIKQGRGLAQVVPAQREQHALRGAIDGVAAAAHALQEGGDAFGRGKLRDEIDMADVDAEFHRSRGHEDFQLARLELPLGGEAVVPAHAAMVGAHRAFAEALAQSQRKPLGQAAGVDENQGGVVGQDQLNQPLVQLIPDFRAHHRRERRPRHFHRNLHLAAEARVDDGAVESPRRGLCGFDTAGFGRCRIPIHIRFRPRGRAGQKAGDGFHRFLRRRQPDALQGPPARRGNERFQPLDRQRQMRAALVAEHGVYLVEDQRFNLGEHGPPARARQQQIQRLGRGDQDMRWARRHLAALVGGGVPGAHRDADARAGTGIGIAKQFGDAGQGNLKIAVDVVVQRLQRRNIENLNPRAESVALPHEAIEPRIERRQGLAAAGGRRDQRVAAPPDRRPGIQLGGGRRRELPLEPAPASRMKPRERH